MQTPYLLTMKSRAEGPTETPKYQAMLRMIIEADPELLARICAQGVGKHTLCGHWMRQIRDFATQMLIICSDICGNVQYSLG